MISKKVMADIYVLGARVLNRIISKLYHALIVTQGGHSVPGSVPVLTELTEFFRRPQDNNKYTCSKANLCNTIFIFNSNNI